MKISSKFLVILSAISTLATDIKLNDISNKYAITSITYEENADCVTSINEYKECYGNNKKTIKKSNLDSVCDSFLTEKCQTFYKSGIAKLNGCDKMSEEVLFTTSIKYEEIGILFAELCSRDVNGEYCPISQYIQNESFSGSDYRNNINKYINDTCKSKKCIEDAVDFLSREIDFDKKLKDFEDKMTSSNDDNKATNLKRQYDGSNLSPEEENKAILEFLNSDYCTNQGKAGNVESSTPSNFSINTYLLTTFILILYTLF